MDNESAVMLRTVALNAAVATKQASDTPDEIIAAAEHYYKFIAGPPAEDKKEGS